MRVWQNFFVIHEEDSKKQPTQKKIYLNLTSFVGIIIYFLSLKKIPMPSHQKYAKISLKKRQKIVEMIVSQGKSIAQASRKYMVKPSTAKLILKKYKETGTFFIKKIPDYSGSKKTHDISQQQHQSLVEQSVEIKAQDSRPVSSQEPIRHLENVNYNGAQFQDFYVPFPVVFFYYTA